MDKLTPQLTEAQLKQNIDFLQQRGMQNSDVQEYVNKYKKDASGNYVLATTEQKPADNTPSWMPRVPDVAVGGNTPEKAIAAIPDAINKVFPGKELGNAVGNSVYGLADAGKKALSGDFSGAVDTINQTGTQNENNYGKVVGDVGKIVTTVGAPALPAVPTVLGKAAQFATVGAASEGSDALAQGKDLKTAAIDAAKGAAVGGATGLAFGAAEKGFKFFGDLLGKTGDKIQTSVIKPSQADIKDGFSLDTIKKYDLGGSLQDTFSKTESKLDDLSKQLNSKLAESYTSVNLSKVYENTVKRLLGNKLETFGSNSQMEGAIDRLRSEISQVAGQNGLVSVPEAQLVKRASGHFGAWTFGNPTPEATASQKVYNTFYNEIKTAIEKASPDGVKEINQQISDLIPVMNALIRRIPVAERNSVLSLSDMISLAAASIEPRSLALSLANFASKSGKVGAFLSDKAPKVGNAIADKIQGGETTAKALLAN